MPTGTWSSPPLPSIPGRCWGGTTLAVRLSGSARPSSPNCSATHRIVLLCSCVWPKSSTCGCAVWVLAAPSGRWWPRPKACWSRPMGRCRLPPWPAVLVLRHRPYAPPSMPSAAPRRLLRGVPGASNGQSICSSIRTSPWMRSRRNAASIPPATCRVGSGACMAARLAGCATLSLRRNADLRKRTRTGMRGFWVLPGLIDADSTTTCVAGRTPASFWRACHMIRCRALARRPP